MVASVFAKYNSARSFVVRPWSSVVGRSRVWRMNDYKFRSASWRLRLLLLLANDQRRTTHGAVNRALVRTAYKRDNVIRSLSKFGSRDCQTRNTVNPAITVVAARSAERRVIVRATPPIAPPRKKLSGPAPCKCQARTTSRAVLSAARC
jgi:hypothetical protein